MAFGPDINDPVVLRDHQEQLYRSRVEGLEPGVIVVARPFDLLAAQVYDLGTAFQVTWSSERGVAVLPTRLADAHREGTVPLWSLEVTGDGWIEQRRSFVRVPAAGALTVQLHGVEATEALAGPPAGPLAGQLVDISEAALRGAVAAASARGVLAEGVEVTASFRFGDRDFALPGRILSHRPSARRADLVEFVVVFDEPVDDADALRKQVYAEQLRARRTRS
jgi:hypothetical protein